MKDLIKEIERNYRGTDNEFEKGFHYGVDMCLKKINNHNIITAPKSIKLSEIVSRLNYCTFDRYSDYISLSGHCIF